MPEGKGTYGSQVGRQSKKDKYQYGGNVDPFSTRNPEGVPAEQVEKAMEDQNMANEGIPTSNAQERSQIFQLGGGVKPPTTPSIAPTPQYKKGGKVREWQKNPKDTKFKVKLPKETFKGKEIKPVPLPKDVSKQYFKGKEIKPAKGFYAKSGKKGKKK